MQNPPIISLSGLHTLLAQFQFKGLDSTSINSLLSSKPHEATPWNAWAIRSCQQITPSPTSAWQVVLQSSLSNTPLPLTLRLCLNPFDLNAVVPLPHPVFYAPAAIEWLRNQPPLRVNLVPGPHSLRCATSAVLSSPGDTLSCSLNTDTHTLWTAQGLPPPPTPAEATALHITLTAAGATLHADNREVFPRLTHSKSFSVISDPLGFNLSLCPLTLLQECSLRRFLWILCRHPGCSVAGNLPWEDVCLQNLEYLTVDRGHGSGDSFDRCSVSVLVHRFSQEAGPASLEDSQAFLTQWSCTPFFC